LPLDRPADLAESAVRIFEAIHCIRRCCRDLPKESLRKVRLSQRLRRQVGDVIQTFSDIASGSAAEPVPFERFAQKVVLASTGPHVSAASGVAWRE
jgi:hypothetical protein